MNGRTIVVIRGEIINMHPDSITIREYSVPQRQLFTEEPYLLVSDEDKEPFDFIKWFKDWNEKSAEEFNDGINYRITFAALPTLNDIFNDPLLHEKYVNRHVASLDGSVTQNKHNRLKLGKRILYNWFVTGMLKLREDSQSCQYVYIEIVQDIKKGDEIT